MKKFIVALMSLALVSHAALIELTWEHSPSYTGGPDEAYILYMSSEGNPFVPLVSVTTNNTVTVTNNNPAGLQFYMTFTNMLGESIPSNIAKVPNRPLPPVIKIRIVSK